MIFTLALLFALPMQVPQNPINDEPLTVPAIVYPADAKKARIQGSVPLQINVDATGHVTEVHALGGPIPLRQAAIDAYAHATYRPILVAGKPAPAIITTSVNFTLTELPPDTDQLVEAKFQPLKANCQALSEQKDPTALDACRKALDMASHFSPNYDLEAHAAAFNDVVLLLIVDGKKSAHLPEAGVLADQAIDLIAPVAHTAKDSAHAPAVAVAYITRAEVRSLAGDLKGSAADCAVAEETLTTLLQDNIPADPKNDRAANYRVQLRETLLLHAIVAERDHHASEARRLRNRAASI